jgi:hypothetical protein
MRLRVMIVTAAMASALGCSDSGVTVHNSSPDVTITSHSNGDEVSVGSAVTLRGAVSDDDAAESLTAVWYVNDEVVCDDVTPDENGVVSCQFDMTAMNATINLTATDPSNAAGNDTLTLTAMSGGAEAPVVTILEPKNNSESASGQTVIFRATVTDNADAPEDLLLSWTSDLDGDFSTQGADTSGESTFGYANLSEGTHIVTLTAVDTDGFYSSDLTVLEIGDCFQTWYYDLDADGYGIAGKKTVEACDQPDGYAANDDDCDDMNPWVNPAATEECEDGMDNNCDGSVDEGCPGNNCFEDNDLLDTFDWPLYQQRVGDLNVTDAASAISFYRDDIEFEGVAGDEISIHAYSEDFDSYIEIYDEDCNLYDSSNSGARGTNAFLDFYIPSDGIYTILVTTGSADEFGDYVLEVIGNKVEVGAYCAFDTYALDVLSSPYSDSATEAIDASDNELLASQYWDDFEYYSFYGDTMQLAMTSNDFDTQLNLYGPDLTLVTYNDDASADNTDSEIVFDTDRTGIYCLAATSSYANSFGDYTVSAAASW